MFELLVVGIQWPPEAFIQRKLKGLAKAGVKVTVAATIPSKQSKATLSGVRFLKLPGRL